MKKFTIGVDVGGTNIKMGLVNASGKIVFRTRLDTKSFIRNQEKLINAIVKTIVHIIEKNNLSKKDITGIGFGLPGLINPQQGTINFLPNIPGWKNVPFKKIIESRLGIPAFVENDVNMITLGEWKYGAGKGCQNLVCITLGTGVGGGLILNNQLYRGEGFVAGEIGHMPLNEKGPGCSCGGFACFESYVGNKILQRKLEKFYKRKNIRFPNIYSLAVKGDKKALQFWQEPAAHIGNALVGVVNLLNPRLIVIGGGVSNNLRFMKKTIEKIIRNRAMKVQSRMVKIVRAKLGDGAGIIGAQVLIREAGLGR